MIIFGHEPQFWIAVGGAVLVKILTSKSHSIRQGFVTVVVAVFAAWLLTDAVLDWLNLEPDVYKAPTGGLLAITGQALIRWLSDLDPWRLIEAWRGGGK